MSWKRSQGRSTTMAPTLSLNCLNWSITFRTSLFIIRARFFSAASVSRVRCHTLARFKSGSFLSRKLRRSRPMRHLLPACASPTPIRTFSPSAWTACSPFSMWRIGTPRETPKASKAHSSSLRRSSPRRARLMTWLQRRNNCRPRARTRKKPIWKLTSNWMWSLSRARSLRRKINSRVRSNKLSTRNSHFWGKLKSRRTLRRSKEESSWTSSRIKLSKSETSTVAACLMMPKSSQSFKLRKKESIKTSWPLLKKSSKITRMKSCSKKNSTRKRWSISRRKSTNKRKTTRSWSTGTRWPLHKLKRTETRS